jgi:hypothetical protein
VKADAGPHPAGRALRSAWWSLALLPAGFLVATLTGQGLLALLGYDLTTDRVPADIALLAGIPALAVLLAPPAAAIGFGRRAARAGDRRGRVPVVLATVLAVGLLVVNLAAYLWG